jgi:HD-GYP domain-containing protein (c-di-GMP phosphodiesterase class II)
MESLRLMSSSQVTKAEILIALSHALDLVEGQPKGHAARTCLIASKIAETMKLSEEDRNSLYNAALLKDAGCSNNSARIHKIFGGDEFLSKQRVKYIDWANPVESVKFAFANTERGAGLSQKLKRMISNIGPPGKVMDEVTLARCTRGAAIAKQLGFDENVAKAIESLDEHWDGKGSARHLVGDEIPLLAQILCLSQTVEVFFTTFGVQAALEMAQNRKGKWFSHEIVQVFKSISTDTEFWQNVSEHAESAANEIPLEASSSTATDADIDQICEAFAMIVDAKSSFTAEHSERVTEYAVMLGQSFELDPERMRVLKRASLLHDIGKLGVSNSILEKPGKLDEEEFAQIRQHPRYSYQILKPIRVFQREAEIASAHHERLDGRGYWRGLSAEQLDLEMRIVAVSDVCDALRAKRPYRDALPLKEVFNILEKEAGTALDPECVSNLKMMLLDAEVPQRTAA